MSLKEKFLNLLGQDKGFRYTVAGFLGFKEILKGVDRHEDEHVELREDMNKLREDMNRGFMLVERHIFALGARWGETMGEKAFREGLKGLLEEELGLRVERWSCFDEEGLVFGYPSLVGVYVAVHDGKSSFS